jgi:hypothetical protein
MGIINSQVTLPTMMTLEKMLRSSTKKIVNLNLEYSFLDGNSIFALCEGLRANRTLVSLNLASNGLNSTSGIYLMKAIAVVSNDRRTTYSSAT